MGKNSEVTFGWDISCLPMESASRKNRAWEIFGSENFGLHPGKVGVPPPKTNMDPKNHGFQ